MAYIDVSGLAGITLLAGIDPDDRDFFLSSNTVGSSVHPIDIYKEMRICRRLLESLRPYDTFLIAKGNEDKGGGKSTERFVTCIAGTRIVPFDTTHVLTVTGTIITDDGQEGISCFDRAPLTVTTVVDINYIPPQVEVITVTIAGALTAQNITDIAAAVDIVLQDDFAGITASTDNAAIALAVETQLADDFASIDLSSVINAIGALNDFDPANDDVAVVTDVTNSTAVDNSQIAIAVESQLADDFAALDNKLNTKPSAVAIRTEMDANSKLAGVSTGVTTDIPATLAALKDFDPVNDVVSRVTLVDQVTLNDDMRGTDDANTTVPPSVSAITADIDANSSLLADILLDTGITIQDLINGLNNFNPTSDTVTNVTNVVNNADMRGTDSVDNSSIATAVARIYDIHKSQFRRRVFDKNANTITLYAADGTTPEYVFNVTSDLTDINPSFVTQ